MKRQESISGGVIPFPGQDEREAPSMRWGPLHGLARGHQRDKGNRGGGKTDESAAQEAISGGDDPIPAHDEREAPASDSQGLATGLQRGSEDGAEDGSPETAVEFVKTPYWALWRSADDAGLREAWGVSPRVSRHFPHEALCRCGFDTVTELIQDLISKNWKPEDLDGTLDRLAWIVPAANGMTVHAFASIRDAEEFEAGLATDRNNRGEFAGNADDLPACPFCRAADKLQILEWSTERADGSELQGPAVRCNRCDTISPLATWRRLLLHAPSDVRATSAK